MLIAFSGAQSTGKTTLLQACKSLPEFKGYTFIDEVTRRIKRTHGVAINNEAENYDKTQLLIMEDHLNNLKLENAVLDRCLLDGYVYTKYFFEQKKVSEYTLETTESSYVRNLGKYDVIFYTYPDIPLINDNERSMDTEFRNRIIELFNKELNYWETTTIARKIHILKGSVKERLETIKNVMDKLQK